jgi:antitoxin component YwqK of YwqJK toxin-antitoxin module
MTDLPRVDFDDLELVVSDDQYMFWKGKPFTGVAVEFFPDGTLCGEVPHLDGIEHGLKRAWYPSGQLRKEANLWQGGVHGYRREWDEQGHLTSEMIGELGIRTAEKTWDEQGRLIRDWHIGPNDDMYEILQIKREKWGHLAPPL